MLLRRRRRVARAERAPKLAGRDERGFSLSAGGVRGGGAAQAAKLQLEEEQRRDRRLRQARAKPHPTHHGRHSTARTHKTPQSPRTGGSRGPG